MSSLAEEIAKLTNPAPEIDPEDDFITETSARITKGQDEEDFEYRASDLRKKNVALLEEVDRRYAGKRISRKHLEELDQLETIDIESSEMSEDGEDESEDAAVSLDEDIDVFKKQLKQKALNCRNDEELRESFESSDNEELSKNSEKSDDEELSESSAKSGDRDDSQNSSVSEEESEAGDIIKNFSNIDVTGEIEKGAAVRSQRNLWDKLLECRIKMQKVLLLANRFPQFDTWKHFKETGDKDYTDLLNNGICSVKNLMDNLIELQTELLINNPETRSIEKGSDNFEQNKSDNEEIPSDIGSEKDPDEDDDVAIVNKSHSVKRKFKMEDYADFLAKRHKSFIPFRNSTIQKWNEKTRLSTGRLTQKSLSAFDQSALKQIEQILQNKSRLIKRTQLKRSNYRVLGKPILEEMEHSKEELAEADEEKRLALTQNEHLKDYDPEVFDDDDFYHQLLRELIETKSIGINDPMALSRKWVEIQKLRSKMKKRVDTKASKGRKIRFDVHPKLVNFMAPVEICTMSDKAKDELYKSLFGQGPVSSTVLS